MLFLALVVVPIVREHDMQSMRSALVHRVGVRFLPVAWIAIALLVATGFVNLAMRGVGPAALLDPDSYTGAFGGVLAAKLLLVAVVVGLSCYHDFHVGPRAGELARAQPEGAEVQRMRVAATRIARLEMLLALAIVALGILLGRSHLLG